MYLNRYPHPFPPLREDCESAFKGIISFFPKCWSYSVEGVDEGGWPQQPKVFFSKLAYLQMAALQSWSSCQPVPSASRLQVLLQISLYPHWLNIGWILFNYWLTDLCSTLSWVMSRLLSQSSASRNVTDVPWVNATMAGGETVAGLLVPFLGIIKFMPFFWTVKIIVSLEPPSVL